MSKQNESGHAKLVATLFQYTDFITSLGPAYNPSLAQINLVNFGTLCTTARAKLDAVKTAEEAWKAATNNREILFSTLGAFSTRILGALRATGASQQTVDDLNALVKKIQGRQGSAAPAKPKGDATTSDAPAPATRSTSQQSFDMRVDHYSKIVTMLQGVADYAPNENEISKVGLQGHYFQLSNANTLVNKAAIALRTARNERDDSLYAPDTGVVDLVKKSKAYILSVYGKASKTYLQAAAFKLRGS